MTSSNCPSSKSTKASSSVSTDINPNTSIESPQIIAFVDAVGSARALAEQAKRRGHTLVHVISNIDERYRELGEFSEFLAYIKDSALFDRVLLLHDYPDVQSLACALKKQGVEHIITGNESGVLLAEELASLLNLPTNDPSLAAARRDKYEMQKALRDYGISYIPSEVVTTEEEVKSFVSRYPGERYVIKPVDGQGSENTCACNGEEVLLHSFRVLSKRDSFYQHGYAKLLVQTLVEGDEYVVNTVSHKGINVVSEIYRYNKLLNFDPETSAWHFVYDADVLIKIPPPWAG